MRQRVHPLGAAAVSAACGALFAWCVLRYAQHVPVPTPAAGHGLLLPSLPPLGTLGAVCGAAICLLLGWARARRRRCPCCHRRLLLSWTRAGSDGQFVTDAVCPWGHGRLVLVRGPLRRNARWAPYGEFWRELRRVHAGATTPAALADPRR